MISITAVVVCYNEIGMIRSCIEALLEQDYSRAHMEILVVDNESSDGTLQWLQQNRYRYFRQCSC